MPKKIPTGRFDLYSSLSNRQLLNVVDTLTNAQCKALIEHMDLRVSNGYEMTFRDKMIYNATMKRRKYLIQAGKYMKDVFDI